MKQFFLTFFANLAALLLVFGAPLFLITVLIFASISASGNSKPVISIQRGSVLVLDLSLNVVDSPEHANANNGLNGALGGDSTRALSLRSLVRAVRKAGTDERIKAIFITGSFQPKELGSGFAALKELREAIIDFKSGKDHKKVYAYLEGPSTKDYYIASTADVIYMNPFGMMEMPGLAAIKTYYKGFFDKLGIDVQVTRVGKYKSAVEPFITNKMSDADREETQKLLDDIWGQFVGEVCKSRNLETTTFQQLVDTDGYIRPEHALKYKLITKLGYFSDVLNELGRIAPASDRTKIPFQQVSILDYIKSTEPSRLLMNRTGRNQIAVLYLEGDIVDGDGTRNDIGGDRFAAELRRLQKDDDVKAVVLRVNSPGGSAYASEVIQHEIRELKKKKPIVVSMGAYAASGGYWVSTYGDHIFAEPNTLTGSIGVFGLFMNVQKLGNTLGFTWDTAKTGAYSDFETVSRPKTPQELNLAQSWVDDIYNKFLDRVSESRHIPRQDLELIAQGRVWSGSEGVRLHLVDELGGLEKAIEYTAGKVHLTAGHYYVEEYPRQSSALEALAQLLSGQEEPVSSVKPDPLTLQLLRTCAELKQLQTLNDPAGVYARLPLGFEIR